MFLHMLKKPYQQSSAQLAQVLARWIAEWPDLCLRLTRVSALADFTADKHLSLNALAGVPTSQQNSLLDYL